VKITMKAVLLVNASDSDKSILDNMMLVFCSAIRYLSKTT